MDFNIPVIHSEKDVLQFNQEVFMRRLKDNPQIRRISSMLRIFASFILMLALGMLLLIRLMGGTIPTESFVFFFLASILFLGMVFFDRFKYKILTRSALKDNLAIFRSESEQIHRAIFHFDEDMVRYQTAFEDVSIPWNTIHMVIEYPSFFIFFSSPSKKYLLPRRCLTNEEQLTMLYRIIEKGVLLTRKDLSYTYQTVFAPDEVTIEKQPGEEEIFFDLRFIRTDAEISSVLYETLFQGRTFRIGSTGSAFLVLAGLALSFFGATTAIRWAGVFSILIGCFVLIFLLIFSTKIVKASILDDAALPTNAHIRFLDRAFLQVYPVGVKRTEWSDVHSVRVAKTGVRILITPSIVTAVPFEVFRTAEEKERFITYIRERAPRIT